MGAYQVCGLHVGDHSAVSDTHAGAGRGTCTCLLIVCAISPRGRQPSVCAALTGRKAKGVNALGTPLVYHQARSRNVVLTMYRPTPEYWVKSLAVWVVCGLATPLISANTPPGETVLLCYCLMLNRYKCVVNVLSTTLQPPSTSSRMAKHRFQPGMSAAPAAALRACCRSHKLVCADAYSLYVLLVDQCVGGRP